VWQCRPFPTNRLAEPARKFNRPGLARYLRRQALLVNHGKPTCLTQQSLRAAG